MQQAFDFKLFQTMNPAYLDPQYCTLSMSQLAESHTKYLSTKPDTGSPIYTAPWDQEAHRLSFPHTPRQIANEIYCEAYLIVDNVADPTIICSDTNTTMTTQVPHPLILTKYLETSLQFVYTTLSELIEAASNGQGHRSLSVLYRKLETESSLLQCVLDIIKDTVYPQSNEEANRVDSSDSEHWAWTSERRPAFSAPRRTFDEVTDFSSRVQAVQEWAQQNSGGDDPPSDPPLAGDGDGDQDEEECPICQEPIGEEPRTQCRTCRKVLHVKCMEEWARHQRAGLHVTCPCCRSPWFEQDSASSASDDSGDDDEDDEEESDDDNEGNLRDSRRSPEIVVGGNFESDEGEYFDEDGDEYEETYGDRTADWNH